MSGGVARNAGLLLAAQAVSRVLGLVVLVTITRNFDVETYGRFALAMTLVALMTPMVDLGLDQHLTRAASQSPERAAGLLSTALGMRTVAAVLVLPLLVGISWLLRHEAETRWMLVSLWVTATSAAVSGSWIALFRAAGRMDLELAVTAISRVLVVVVSLAAIAAGLPLTRVAALQAIASVAGLLVVAVIGAARGARPAWRGLRQGWGTSIRGALPFALTSVLVTLSLRLDILMLGQLRGDRDVGLYNSGASILFGFMLVSQAIVTAVFPRLARAGRLDSPEARGLIPRTLTASLMLSIPVAVVGVLLHDRMIVAIYGSAYAEAGLPLAVLLIAVPVMFVTNLAGHLLGAVGEQRIVLRIAAVNILVNLGLNLLLIPRLGPMGAAVATLCTEACGLIALAIALRSRAPAAVAWSALSRVALAAILMAATLWLASALPLGLVLAVGALAYASVLFATGVVRRTDLAAVLARGVAD